MINIDVLLPHLYNVTAQFHSVIAQLSQETTNLISIKILFSERTICGIHELCKSFVPRYLSKQQYSSLLKANIWLILQLNLSHITPLMAIILYLLT